MVNTVRNTLELWALQLVPSLLPFMILSSLFTVYSYQFFSQKMSVGNSICLRLFGLSAYGCYILLMGHLCGYPMGAKITANAYKDEMISRQEADYLLTICNQSSPAFLEFYVGVYALNGVISTGALFSLFYISTFMTSLITRKVYPVTENNISKFFGASKNECPTITLLLDRCITDSCLTVLRIGGYMVLFSVAANWIMETFDFFGIATSIVASFLEITCGLSLLKNQLFESQIYVYLILLLTASGGLCTMAQIKGMLTGTSLSIKPYIFGKIIYSVILLLLFLLLSNIQTVKI